jgi:hypothetical protein
MDLFRKCKPVLSALCCCSLLKNAPVFYFYTTVKIVWRNREHLDSFVKPELQYKSLLPVNCLYSYCIRLCTADIVMSS